MSEIEELKVLDLNDLCVERPATTFLLRVRGESMVDANIRDGDLLIVDGSLEARHGEIVVAEYNQDFTVKRLELSPTPRLVPANPQFDPLPITEDSGFVLVGVVTFCVRNLR